MVKNYSLLAFASISDGYNKRGGRTSFFKCNLSCITNMALAVKEDYRTHQFEWADIAWHNGLNIELYLSHFVTALNEEGVVV